MITTLSEAVDALLTQLATAPSNAADGRAPIVLLDGRSGSGKTALAAHVAHAFGSPLTVVHLDDIYPGWTGLDAASTHITDYVLDSAEPRWQRYDWQREQVAEWASIDRTVPLLIEGVGSLSRANAALASFSVWLELDVRTRRQRAIERDGDTYEPHWDDWAAQEDVFIAREHPEKLADLVVDLGSR